MKYLLNLLTKNYQRLFGIFLLVFFSCWNSELFAAGGQLLNSTFFPNPADTAEIKTFEFIGGNLFFVPTLKFTGTAHRKKGSAESKVYDPIPYMYLNYRFTDKWVVGVNMLPSVYGDILWPEDSIVAKSSINTNVLFYRVGILTSYNITSDLVLGVGFNIERLASQLSFISDDLGYVRNKTSGYDSVTDFGFSYKLNSQNKISLAYYTPIRSVVPGVSNAGKITNYNYSSLRIDAAVTFLNLEHFVNDYWVIYTGIYFSKWSAYKYFAFYNTVIGDIILPAHWKNVWTFLLTSKHKMSDKTSVKLQFLYETNPVFSAHYNYTGFPLSAALGFTGGVEYNFYKNFYVNIIASYGLFAPDARINNLESYGNISANIYTGILECSWKF